MWQKASAARPVVWRRGDVENAARSRCTLVGSSSEDLTMVRLRPMRTARPARQVATGVPKGFTSRTEDDMICKQGNNILRWHLAQHELQSAQELGAPINVSSDSINSDSIWRTTNATGGQCHLLTHMCFLTVPPSYRGGRRIETAPCFLRRGVRGTRNGQPLGQLVGTLCSYRETSSRAWCPYVSC